MGSVENATKKRARLAIPTGHYIEIYINPIGRQLKQLIYCPTKGVKLRIRTPKFMMVRSLPTMVLFKLVALLNSM